jgi:hypothetical protein
MTTESGNAQNLMVSDIWLGLFVVVVVLVVAEIGNSRCLCAIIVAAEIVEDRAKYVADLGLPCVGRWSGE